MNQYKYAIIKGDEDGNPVNYLSNDESNNMNINDLMESYSIKKWVERYDDPMCWPLDEGMLVKIQCINPKPVKVVTSWELPK